MNKNIFILLSVVFHPIFINLISFFLVIELTPYLAAGFTNEAKLFYGIYVFVITSLVPLLVVLARKILGATDSILLEKAEDRNLPYIVTAASYLFSYYFFQRLNSPVPLQAFMLAGATVAVVLLIINLFSKISAHTTSFGVLAGVIITSAPFASVDIRIYLATAIILAGLTATARLALQAHSQKQLYSGFLLGIGIMWIML